MDWSFVGEGVRFQAGPIGGGVGIAHVEEHFDQLVHARVADVAVIAADFLGHADDPVGGVVAAVRHGGAFDSSYSKRL